MRQGQSLRASRTHFVDEADVGESVGSAPKFVNYPYSAARPPKARHSSISKSLSRCDSQSGVHAARPLVVLKAVYPRMLGGHNSADERHGVGGPNATPEFWTRGREPPKSKACRGSQDADDRVGRENAAVGPGAEWLFVRSQYRDKFALDHSEVSHRAGSASSPVHNSGSRVRSQVETLFRVSRS